MPVVRRLRVASSIAGAVLLAISLLLPSSASAVIDLEITEIWPGQPGTDVTLDWFEITNYGDEAWIDGISPALAADDSSAAIGTAAPIANITDILPGESVIVLMETTALADRTNFFNVWNPVKPQNMANIGNAGGVSGLGLGQPADGVALFLGGVLTDLESYTGSASSQSWDVPLAAYSTVGNASGAVATLALGGSNDTPAIGSPGSVVPEPSAFVLAGLGGLGVLAARRRRCA